VQYLFDLIIARPRILAFWVFVVGSAIGSFLNVVIYRLPRGMSLSKPGSHCPKCGRPIRWYDNLPIAGWLLLGGKCRDCKAEISPRYPLVELAVAVLFVAAAYFDVYAPTVGDVRSAGASAELAAEPTRLGPRLVALFAHVWTGCITIAVLLIAWDGMRVPWRLAAASVAVAAVATPFLEMAAIWPLVAATGITLIVAIARNRPAKRPT
jgi:leader peptidase (prepilin peptidase)/N-methyltransferase